ncbi:MAG: hypothetical protein AAGF45_09385 [Pseudomonadota bacterium]
MNKQVFEVLPQPDDLPGLYDILRYENAAQRGEIASLEAQVERSAERVGELEARLDEAQAVIDALSAALAAAKQDG